MSTTETPTAWGWPTHEPEHTPPNNARWAFIVVAIIIMAILGGVAYTHLRPQSFVARGTISVVSGLYEASDEGGACSENDGGELSVLDADGTLIALATFGPGTVVPQVGGVFHECISEWSVKVPSKSFYQLQTAGNTLRVTKADLQAGYGLTVWRR